MENPFPLSSAAAGRPKSWAMAPRAVFVGWKKSRSQAERVRWSEWTAWARRDWLQPQASRTALIRSPSVRGFAGGFP